MSSPANDTPNALRLTSIGDIPSLQLESTSSSDVVGSGVTADSSASSSENRNSVIGDPDVTALQSRIKALKVSCPPNLEHHGSRGDREPNFRGNSLTQQVFQQGVAPQGVNSSHVANQYFHGGRFPSAEVPPPLYATAAATHMHSTGPYYTGVQPPGVVYPSQYGMGGYPYNANILPLYMPGYAPHTQGFDVQQINKVYGQHGYAPPPFVDPRLHFQQSFGGDMYNVSGHFDHPAMRGGVIGNQGGAFEAQVRPDFAQNYFGQRGGAEYPPSMGFYMPAPNSALGSPVLPASPIGGNGLLGGRSDINSPNSGRSGGSHTGWQSQRGFENLNYQKPYSFLEELKSGKGRRFELSDIVGHVAEFSVDQHGSRFIQQKLEYCSAEDKESVFQEVVPHACNLMTDVFGNYVIQKFFEYGTPDQRRDLAKALTGQILPLSLQMYGCRVIQKALDVIEIDQKIELIRELNGHIMRCVRDQNGNHVIQKCIECIPAERIDFVISAFRGQVASLSMHPYGCRVVQRILEHCTDELQSQFIVDEILESVCSLAQDQYGNYVTQHVLERGKPQERTQIIKNLGGQVVKMSQHKFASNVIEKCLEYGDAPSRELIINEVVGETDGNDNLLVMMKDQYANYVVQKILEKCAESQRELLLGRIKVHLNGLKKYTYGKHIVARFEQLFGEMSEATS